MEQLVLTVFLSIHLTCLSQSANCLVQFCFPHQAAITMEHMLHHATCIQPCLPAFARTIDEAPFLLQYPSLYARRAAAHGHL